MNYIYLGLGLMVTGAVLFIAGRLRTRKSSVEASTGSVAVGGNNSGSITNINTDKRDSAATSSHGITIVAIIIELAGIAVTIWHAIHLASK